MTYPPESYNLATGTKWYMYFPLHTILEDVRSEDAALNLYNFTLPEISSVELTFPINGIEYPIPGHTRSEDKTITFNYLLSSNWYQYFLLYEWFNLIAQECGGVGTPVSSPNEYLLDVTVMVISEYKNPLFQITYHNAWIKSLASVDFNYQDEDEVISHSFDIAYSHFTFERIAKVLN